MLPSFALVLIWVQCTALRVFSQSTLEEKMNLENKKKKRLQRENLDPLGAFI